MASTSIEWNDGDIERFEKFYDSPSVTSCHNWNGGLSSDGYGSFWLSGRNVRAHVLAFVICNGYRPIVVRHTCDNPRCVNPRHLIGGNYRDNALDARERGRTPRTSRVEKVRKPRKNTNGSKNGRAVLTEQQVLEIRRKYSNEGRTSLRLLASEYSVSKTLIQRIVQGKLWSHV